MRRRQLLSVFFFNDTATTEIYTLSLHDALPISLQGNLSQNRRQEALDGFRDGKYQILVATDSAARGIDVSSISHVINYDMPNTADAYTHRIGRTGRAAKTGDAFTFITREDDEMVRNIEGVLGEKVDRRTLKGFDYSKPAPARDADLARPPRVPQHRNKQKKSAVSHPTGTPKRKRQHHKSDNDSE